MGISRRAFYEKLGIALPWSLPQSGLMDKFDEIFGMQKALNERIGVYTDDLSEEEKTKWILNYTRAMEQELAELVDSVSYSFISLKLFELLFVKFYIIN